MELPIQRADIQRLIPQRNPIVMVSTLEAYHDMSLQSSFLISEDCLFIWADHLTESGLIEHMAQSVALHTGYSYYLRNLPAPLGYIGSIPRVEIVALPKVGQTLRTQVQIIQEFMGVTLVEIITKLEGEIIANAQMKTVIADM